MNAGFEVEIASIAGGKPPVDAASLGEGSLTEEAKRFQDDEGAQKKLDSTLPVDAYASRLAEFDAVVLPGGHGTAVDFAPRCESYDVRVSRGVPAAVLQQRVAWPFPAALD